MLGTAVRMTASSGKLETKINCLKQLTKIFPKRKE